MERFAGQPLGANAKILVLGTPKLGNFVVLTPLLRALKRNNPTCELWYRGSERTADLEEACPWIDHRLESDPPLDSQTNIPEDTNWAVAIDLLINADAHNAASAELASRMAPRYVVGQALGVETGEHPLQQLALDPGWAQPDLLERYGDWLKSGSIRELHCRVCWLAADDAERVELPWRPPEILIPAVLIAVNGEREAKLWPLDHWLELLSLIRHRLGIQPSEVGLVGAAPPASPQGSGHHGEGKGVSRGLVIEAALVRAGVQDLRGKLSLTELMGAFRGCDLAICVDSGPLHLAAAAGCPTVAIFGTDAAGLGASPQRLWAPRQASVTLATSSVSCPLCQDEGFLNSGCLIPEHGCLLGVSPTTVVDSAIEATRQSGHQPAKGLMQGGAGWQP